LTGINLEKRGLESLGGGFNPAGTLAVSPLTLLDLSFAGVVSAFSVLLTILPLAVVLAVVGPGEDTVAFLFVVDIFSFVLATVGPGEDTSSVHLVALPLAVVLATIGPGVNTLAVDVVVNEVSAVFRAISPQELSVTVLLSILVGSLVACTIGPHFLSLAVLLVLKPLAFVLGAVGMVVDSVTMSFIVFPVAVVHVTIGMDKSASAVCFVVLPVAFIQGAINPNLNALSVLTAFQVPLSVVFSAVLKLHELFLDALDSIVRRLGRVIEGREFLTNVHDKLSSLEDLSVRLGVSWRARSLPDLGLETILRLNSSTGNKSLEVSLDEESSLEL